MFRAGPECIKAEEGGYQEKADAGDEDYRIGGGVRKKAPASGSYGSAGTQGDRYRGKYAGVVPGTHHGTREHGRLHRDSGVAPSEEETTCQDHP